MRDAGDGKGSKTDSVLAFSCLCSKEGDRQQTGKKKKKIQIVIRSMKKRCQALVTGEQNLFTQGAPLQGHDP